MNMLKIKLLFVVCSFISLNAFAQNNSNEQLTTKFQQYVTNNFQEKMFVHTDKNFYLSGETLWFKIYNTDIATNKFATVSKVAYAELLNTENKSVLHATIELQDGTGNGQFVLPLTLPSGNYIFRAYTNWMKNFSEELIFHKNITVVNVFEKNEDTIKHSLKYDIQFFPEGGNLVNNVQSKVAFKAVNNFGVGINFQGKIINQNNEVITTFSPQKFGIGSFLFTPNTTNIYKAVIVTETNDTLTFSLPTINHNGYVMFTEVKDNNINISVQSSNEVSNEMMYLVAHNNKTIQINNAQNLQNGKTNFSINSSSLNEGVTFFTIFNSSNNPVCERLFYKRPQPKEFVEAKINNQQFNSRDKVSIDVLSYNNQKQPIASNMSISVFKSDALQTADVMDIQQYFWLTSNLKGNIENAGYYLNEANEQTDVALDNLLLTQGWRRFNWNDILQNTQKEFKYLPEYESQLITGKVVNKTTLTPAEGIGVYLSMPGKEFSFTAAITNNKGEFVAVMPKVSNKTSLIAQTNNRTDSNYRIDINSAYWNNFSSLKTPEFSIQKSVENELNNYGLSVQSDYIYNPKPIYLQTFHYTPFYTNSDNTYLLDNYTRFTTMEEVMREYVIGISVRKKSGKFIFNSLDAPRFQFFHTDPLILLDGVPVFDADNIMATDPLKIQKIDLVTRKFFYSSFAFDGIVSYTSYNGKMATSALNKESLLIDYDALQQQREFYAPKYELKESKESRLPDYRTLLYWSPNVHTNKNGKTNIDFYTSDLDGNFVALIQGLTQNGEPVKSIIKFNVVK